jgi:hypothetical protein
MKPLFLQTEQLASVENSPYALCSFRLNTVGGNAPWSEDTKIFKEFWGTPPGEYQFEVKAKDQAGNISSVATRNFRVTTQVQAPLFSSGLRAL